MTSDNEKNKTNLGPLTLEMVMKLGGQQKPKENEQFDDFVELIAREKNIMQETQHDIHSVKTINLSTIKSLAPVNLTMSQIKNMTDEELIKTLTGELNPKANRIADGSMQLISNELLTRQIKEASKPHWTITPAFFLLVATLILTAIPVTMIAYDLISEKTKSSDNHANESEEIKTNSKP